MAALAVMGMSAVANAQPQLFVHQGVLNEIQNGDVLTLDNSEVGDQLNYSFTIENQGNQTLAVTSVTASEASANATVLEAGFTAIFNL